MIKTGFDDFNMVQEFQEWSNMTVDEMNRYVKKALATSASILVQNTKNILTSVFPNAANSSNKHGYSVPLVEAVRQSLHMEEAPAIAKVHILGKMGGGDDGTWRLRFFEDTVNREGRGQIGGLNFFGSAWSSSVSHIDSNIDSVMSELENKINSLQ